MTEIPKQQNFAQLITDGLKFDAIGKVPAQVRVVSEEQEEPMKIRMEDTEIASFQLRINTNEETLDPKWGALNVNGYNNLITTDAVGYGLTKESPIGIPDSVLQAGKYGPPSAKMALVPCDDTHSALVMAIPSTRKDKLRRECNTTITIVLPTARAQEMFEHLRNKNFAGTIAALAEQLDPKFAALLQLPEKFTLVSAESTAKPVTVIPARQQKTGGLFRKLFGKNNK